MLLITLEILAVIVVPLLILYLRARWPLRVVIPCLLVIPAFWYLIAQRTGRPAVWASMILLPGLSACATVRMTTACARRDGEDGILCAGA